MKPDPLILYGADACPDTARARQRLDYLGVPYRYVSVDQDSSARAVAAALAGGSPALPTVVVSDSAQPPLIEPTLGELEHALRAGGWLA